MVWVSGCGVGEWVGECGEMGVSIFFFSPFQLISS